ncbi:uncharacterized protein LOC141685140 [Apium graveolens]|uniref:uncharacterized protein LOC141685140 n=1 Tax=Apium graveolens TaxID=4045 RepID=UPI003D78BD26
MYPDKASGPDGLNPAFFQNFWLVLGKEVYISYRDWLRNNSFPANVNGTNVVLIPKKENACSIKDLRPIALCNVLYKILSKVLANRLKRLSLALTRAVSDGVIHGVQVTPTTLVIFHILFADDSFLFFHANHQEVVTVKGLLDEYARVSGQVINYQKSSIFFCDNVKQEHRNALFATLGVHNNLENLMYLGLSSLVGHSKKRVFGFVKERMWKRLQGWGAKKISRDDTAPGSIVLGIAKCFWGIWFFRNKKVWESKSVNAATAMDWSSKGISEWRQVDATDYQGASSFSIGMVLRNHEGSFVAGKTLCQTMVPSVLEAEARAIMEGLH